MSEYNDGGPAYPTVAGHLVYSNGMSLRDWFAGQALVGLLSGQYAETSTGNLKEVPEEAYLVADAMLEARK